MLQGKKDRRSVNRVQTLGCFDKAQHERVAELAT
jgi:hypothetical protein